MFHANDNRKYHRVCLCAYTLNDTQPVVCTHIGDQPLYYLVDDDEDFDGGDAA